MKSYKFYIAEKESGATGGQDAGKIEVGNITVDEAKKWAVDRGFDIDEELPNFEKNFKLAQAKARQGWTQRKDMPVIEDKDVKRLQARLQQGYIDINKPFSKDTKEHTGNPFPEGLSGKDAKDFLLQGIRDGDMKDDIVKVDKVKVKVKDLKPIQKQIYWDKSMGGTIEFGVKGSINFISKKSFFIITKDNYILDGHHRFMSGMIIDPSMSVNALQIDMPLDRVLPLTIAYGDAVGNKRNK